MVLSLTLLSTLMLAPAPGLHAPADARFPSLHLAQAEVSRDAEIADLKARIAALAEQARTMDLSWPSDAVTKATVGFVLAGCGFFGTPVIGGLAALIMLVTTNTVDFLVLGIIGAVGFVALVAGLVIGILGVVEGESTVTEKRAERTAIVRQRQELEHRLLELEKSGTRDGPWPSVALATF